VLIGMALCLQGYQFDEDALRLNPTLCVASSETSVSFYQTT
jgi:hypothetical protein